MAGFLIFPLMDPPSRFSFPKLPPAPKGGTIPLKGANRTMDKILNLLSLTPAEREAFLAAALKGAVEEDGVLLQAQQPLPAEQARRLRRLGQGQDYHIGPGQQLVQL